MLLVSAVIGLEIPRARKKAMRPPTSKVSAAMISWMVIVRAIELSAAVRASAKADCN